MKTVTEMAKEAGYNPDDGGVYKFDDFDIDVFAALVREGEREKWMERTAILIRGEREACAKDADDQWVRNPNVSGGDAIRSRGSCSE